MRLIRKSVQKEENKKFISRKEIETMKGRIIDNMVKNMEQMVVFLHPEGISVTETSHLQEKIDSLNKETTNRPIRIRDITIGIMKGDSQETEALKWLEAPIESMKSLTKEDIIPKAGMRVDRVDMIKIIYLPLEPEIFRHNVQNLLTEELQGLTEINIKDQTGKMKNYQVVNMFLYQITVNSEENYSKMVGMIDLLLILRVW